MSSSGLIYAVIVGAWAAYLVPMWLRRQDELNEARPTERFSTAIRLLSGRAALERRAERRLEDAQATQLLQQPSSRPVKSAQPGQPAQSGQSAQSASPGKANARAVLLARRRRMVVLLFAAFTAGMLATAVVGIGLLWLPAIPALLFSCYIAHMRRQERRRLEAKLGRRRAAAAPAPAPAPVPAPVAAPPAPTTSGTGALLSADLAEVEHEDWVAGVRERQSPRTRRPRRFLRRPPRTPPSPSPPAPAPAGRVRRPRKPHAPLRPVRRRHPRASGQ
ncbi:hypothetical protein ACFQZC_16260 [Streptacidiphilus monticola]